MGLENYVEQSKVMNCGYSDKVPEELKKEGWEEDYSFHSGIPEQWNMACEKVNGILMIGDERGNGSGDWEVVLVRSEDENERRDGVTYIYKRKTNKRKEWEKERGC